MVAGAGVAVAKHGNRSSTSKCGSADVLEALGARIDLDPDAVARCIEETGLGLHVRARRTTRRSATSSRCAARWACGRSSTCSGPLTNPAGAPRQLIGVADPAYLERMGRALAILGCERALIVHGRDGMDEVSTGAVSDVIAVQGPAVARQPHRSRSRSASRPPRTGTSPAATRPTTPRCCAPCWRASRARRATWSS